MSSFAEGEASAPTGRVWVHGNEKVSPGLLGFVLSARKEPKGELLRCVYSTGKSFAASSAGMIQQCRRLDLLHNMFVDNQNGSYRSIEVRPLLGECRFTANTPLRLVSVPSNEHLLSS